MKGIWWKMTGAVLVLYMIVGGLYFPLSTGIIDVQPIRLETGQQFELRITTYNTRLLDGGEVEVWLYDTLGHILQADLVHIDDNHRLRAEGIIPSQLKDGSNVRFLNMLVYQEGEGFSILPNALSVVHVVDSPHIAGTDWLATMPNKKPSQKITFPFRNILAETIRNTYFHVTLWFALMFIMLGSAIESTRFLLNRNPLHDSRAAALASVGFLFGILGLLTGALWARHTWGAYWSWDIKQNMTAIALLIYGAYFILRASVENKGDQGRLGAVYNLFAFVMLIPLLYIIPRMADSLHPGAGGNPGLGGEDLDNNMRMFFYPGIIGMTLLGYWIASLVARYNTLKALIASKLYSRQNSLEGDIKS